MDRESFDLPGYRQHVQVQPVEPDLDDPPGPHRTNEGRTEEEDVRLAYRDRKRRHRKHRHRSRRRSRDDFEEEEIGAGLSAAAADNAAFSGGAPAEVAHSENGSRSENPQLHPQHQIQKFGAKVAPRPPLSPSPPTSSSNLGELQLQQTEQTVDEFVKQNISMRLCGHYIPNPAEDSPDSTKSLCSCNRPAQWHREHGVPVEEPQSQERQPKIKWLSETCAKVVPTNAFGRMKLQGFGRLGVTHKPHYIRIDSETRNFEALWELMTSPKYWALPLPNLVLSVIGAGNNKERMSAKLFKKVKQGLTNVASGVKRSS